jgi:peroxiredoxin Q/BCP
VKRLALVAPLLALACTREPPAPAKVVAPEAPPPRPAKAALTAGDPAPAVTLTLHDGRAFALAEHTDGLVFLYFYPKDDTPGCTVEAQGLRDGYAALTAAGVTVIGVSLQDAASHQAFIDKHALPFPLAVDDGTVAAAFDVPVQGEYAARHSFLLKGGKVVKAWRQVTPAQHAAEVLSAAQTAG